MRDANGRPAWLGALLDPLERGELGAIVALTLAGFHGLKRSIVFWIALVISAIHITGQIVFVVILSVFIEPFDPQAVELALNYNYFRNVLAIQAGVPMVLMGGYVGARITSRDRMMGGLEFLLSKAIKPSSYMIARLATPTLTALLVVFLPVLVLEILLVLLVDDLPAGIGRVFFGALVAGLLATVVLGPLSAGLGALVDNPRRAMALWLGVTYVTAPLTILALSLNLDWWWAVNPMTTLNQIAVWLMGQPFDGNLGLAWLIVVGVAILPIAIMRWRIGEVVG